MTDITARYDCRWECTELLTELGNTLPSVPTPVPTVRLVPATVVIALLAPLPSSPTPVGTVTAKSQEESAGPLFALAYLFHRSRCHCRHGRLQQTTPSRRSRPAAPAPTPLQDICLSRACAARRPPQRLWLVRAVVVLGRRTLCCHNLHLGHRRRRRICGARRQEGMIRASGSWCC